MNECDAGVGIGEAAERGLCVILDLRCRAQDIRGGHRGQHISPGWRSRPVAVGLCLAALLAGQGCGARGPEAVGDRFVEAYYAAADLGKALQFAEGLAAKKIQDQQRLLQGQSGPQSSAGRRVTFRRIETTRMEGKLFLRYEIRIEVQGAGAFTRNSLLALGEGPSGWRITNFSEVE